MPRKQAITIIKRAQMPSLTTKFDEAILIYAKSKAVTDFGVDTRKMVRAAISAYRMGYEDLYFWMKRNRYRWNSRAQGWDDLRKRD